MAAGHAGDAFEAQVREWPETSVWAAEGPEDLDWARWANGGLEELATADGVDIVVVATTGMTALPAVLAALRAGRRVALANKEALVTGGHLVRAPCPRTARTRWTGCGRSTASTRRSGSACAGNESRTSRV